MFLRENVLKPILLKFANSSPLCKQMRTITLKFKNNYNPIGPAPFIHFCTPFFGFVFFFFVLLCFFSRKGLTMEINIKLPFVCFQLFSNHFTVKQETFHTNKSMRIPSQKNQTNPPKNLNAPG